MTQHDAATKSKMTYQDASGESYAIGLKLPRTQQHWWDKRNSTDAVLNDIGGVVTREGDETVGDYLWGVLSATCDDRRRVQRHFQGFDQRRLHPGFEPPGRGGACDRPGVAAGRARYATSDHGLGLAYLVVAERVAASSGLGYLSLKAMHGFQVDVIFLAIAIIGLLGLITDQLFRFLRLKVAVWAL